jgi:hypothetical protein
LARELTAAANGEASSARARVLGEVADQWIERFEGLGANGKRRRFTLKITRGT